MSTRRRFLAAATLGGMSVLAGRARAEGARIRKRVGIVYPEPPSPEQRGWWDGFDQELRERGWVEGRNLALERRYFHGDRSRLPGLMAELVALDVDVIFVQGVWAVEAAKRATDRIPIVFAVGDAVGRNVVTNLARPEANATGVSNRFVESMDKCVELLQQVSPGLSRVAALMNTTLGYPPALFDANRRRGVEVLVVDLIHRGDLVAACAAVAKWPADGVLIAQGLRKEFQGDVVDAIARLRVPAMYPKRAYVELGGLLSFEVNFAYVFRRSASYIDRLLRGARPSDLPVEQPNVNELALNLRTARSLGLAIPRELLVRADWIVE